MQWRSTWLRFRRSFADGRGKEATEYVHQYFYDELAYTGYPQVIDGGIGIEVEAPYTMGEALRILMGLHYEGHEESSVADLVDDLFEDVEEPDGQE